jgi:hypothetical protein
MAEKTAKRRKSIERHENKINKEGRILEFESKVEEPKENEFRNELILYFPLLFKID